MEPFCENSYEWKANVALRGYKEVFSEVRVKNFEEYLSQNSQFRKALNIILTIFLGGSFTQDFEELLFLFNISSDPVTPS